MLISKVRDRVRRELLEFAWSQWAQLGVSSHPSRVDRWAMDPESLMLFTLEVGRRDPRLFDEMLDWIALNAKLISLQRLRNLTSRFPIDVHLVDAALSWVETATKSVRWRDAGVRVGKSKTNRQPVFSRDNAAFVGRPDPTFERHGYLRSPVIRSGKSEAPDIRTKINFAFRLRHLFGPGTRSEVMRILLTFGDEPLDAARIADEAGFAKRNVSETLGALVSSGAVKARWVKNERVFLAYRSKWATLLEIGLTDNKLPTFVSWSHLLPALVEILLWLEQETEAVDSEYMASSRARDLFARIESDFEQLELELPTAGPLRGAEFLPPFLEAVEAFVTAATKKS